MAMRRRAGYGRGEERGVEEDGEAARGVEETASRAEISEDETSEIKAEADKQDLNARVSTVRVRVALLRRRSWVMGRRGTWSNVEGPRRDRGMAY